MVVRSSLHWAVVDVPQLYGEGSLGLDVCVHDVVEERIQSWILGNECLSSNPFSLKDVLDRINWHKREPHDSPKLG